MKPLFFLLALLVQVAAAAQTNVNGRVLGPSGNPLAGATVVVKSSALSTATDSSGGFTLTGVPARATLLVSFIGYQTVEEPLNSRTTLTITLDQRVEELDEAVVIAYGTTTRRLATGNISKVSAAEIAQQPVANPLAALQGRAPGVLVTTQNGLPGSHIAVQIRGRTSVAAGNDPLYIIDGVPFNASPSNQGIADFTFASGSISPLSSLNPADIESIEILKDADATALYGSRASNGVVLITTKKGREGGTQVAFNLYRGISRVGRFAPFLGVEDYMTLRREAYRNDSIAPTLTNAPDLLLWDSTQTTDWQRYIMGGSAPVTDAQLSFSGGRGGTTFLVRGSFRDEGSVLPGDHRYRKGGVHVNLQHAPQHSRLHLGLSANYSRDENRQPGSVLGYFNLPPHFPLYNADGTFNWQLNRNPAAALLQRSRSHTEALVSQATLSYRLAEGLLLKTAWGFSRSSLEQWSARPQKSTVPQFGEPNSASFGNNAYRSLLAEPQLTYNRQLGKTVLAALAGATWQHTSQERTLIKATHYSNEGLMETISGGAAMAYADNRFSEYKYASLFGRLNLQHDRRYLLSASLRRDGSSRFGPGYRRGWFGALGGGWIFSEAKAVQRALPFLTYGKLRGSWGRVGNDQIADYGYLATYGNGIVYGSSSTLQPSRLANPNYGWERTAKLEAALELGFWKDRLLATAAWYRHRSDNQLVDHPLPSQAGFASYQANLPALVQNRGWEFSLQSANWQNSQGRWTTTVNLTLPQNKLLSFPGLAQSGYGWLLVEGEDMAVVRGYRYLGVDPATGIAQFEDVDKDGLLSSTRDYVVLGTTSPTLFGGMGNSLTYRGFQLDIFFQGVRQKGFTEAAAPGVGIGNRLHFVLDRWQAPGDQAPLPRASTTPGRAAYTANNRLAQSSAVFTDASYIRLKTLSLSYRFGLPMAGQRTDGRIYLQGQNLLTIAGKTRIDPELNNSTGIPPLQSLVAGLQLNF